MADHRTAGGPELVAEDVHQPVAVRFDQGGVLHVLSLAYQGIVTRVDLHVLDPRILVTSWALGLDNAAFDTENRMFVSGYAGGGITEILPTADLCMLCGFDGPARCHGRPRRDGVRGRPLPGRRSLGVLG
ncbi:hypothetical protein SALBM311S_05749 [Streptomyces alboniger]